MNKYMSKNDQYKKALSKTLGSFESNIIKDDLNSYEKLDQDYFTYYVNKIDDYASFFSSQQFTNIDWDKFENHTFFDSAYDKVQYSIKKILNEFPYDASEFEKQQYHKSLDGYTNYILQEKIPKSKNYLRFDGSSHVKVEDENGFVLKDFNNKKIKRGLLNPKAASFSFDFWLRFDLDLIPNNHYVVFQKKNSSSTIGYTCYLEKDTAGNNLINFYLNNENNGYIKASTNIPQNYFNHIVINCFSQNNKKIIEIIINGEKQRINLNDNFINSVIKNDIDDQPLFIGRGSSHGHVLSPQNFVGLLDEFRFFKKVRSLIQINKESKINISKQDSLILYFKFNEPEGDYNNNILCLDSSGNKLHGIINNTTNNITKLEVSSLREKYIYNTTIINTPVIYEKDQDSPVIFPNFNNLLNIQNVLLEKARKYDIENPNVFWNLLPSYLFLETADFERSSHIFVNENKVEEISEDDLLGVKQNANNSLIKIVTIWSRFFDQFKLFIDNITNSFDIDYKNLNNESDIEGITLPLSLKLMGFDIKEIFPNMTKEKFLNKNFVYNEVFSERNIRSIQNILWKRFLINTQDFLRSKGTRSGINTIFNSFGIDKDKFFSIREFNTQNILNYKNNFISKKQNTRIINFMTKENLYKKINTFSSNKIREGSVLQIENFTSNTFSIKENWTLQTFFKFKIIDKSFYKKSQSLLRIDKENNVPYINIVFKRESLNSDKGKIIVCINETDINSEIVSKEVEDIDILDGFPYFINVSKEKINDSTSKYSFFIKKCLSHATNDIPRKISLITSNSAFYSDILHDYTNSNIIIGNKEYSTKPNSNFDYTEDFQGEVFSLKLWKIILKENIINNISRDYTNYSQNYHDQSKYKDKKENLLINFILKESHENYNYNPGDTLSLKNFGNHASTNINLFIGDKVLGDVFSNNMFIVEKQNNVLDFPNSYNRININSLESDEYKDYLNNDNINPDYYISSFYSEEENVNMSVDFSCNRFLNEEISKMINVHETLTKTMSNRNSLYEREYTSLLQLRSVFFEKLEKEVDFKPLYQIYKYFDNILEDLILDAVPSRINYTGFNYVYESHILERHKYEYKLNNSRLPIKDPIKIFINYEKFNDVIRSDHNDIILNEERSINNNNIFNVREE